MKAIVLFSGGLDSTLMLAIALKEGRDCLALSFDYGQRHIAELDAAKKILDHYGIKQRIVKLDLERLSSLTGGKEVVKGRSREEILKESLSPNYVPARNTLFLSHAFHLAESISAGEIWFGCNANDSSFPDCSKAFVEATQRLFDTAASKKAPRIITPLIAMDKSMIAAMACSLNVPVELTHSCYSPIQGRPCHQCDACVLRESVLS